MDLDFVAVALTDGQYRDIYWRFALGARSDRYKKIAVRMGRGMAGKVLQGMTPHIVAEFPEGIQDEVLEYPIFLVESLASGVGVTIKSTIHMDRQAYGVLLVGQRSRREFAEEEIVSVQTCASILAQLYDEEPIDCVDSGEMNGVYTLDRDLECTTKEAVRPFRKLLRQAQAVGMTCELLDQRITRLSSQRQEEILEILAFLIQECDISTVPAKLVIGQDELGQTLIEFEGFLFHPVSQELFLPVMPQLKSLKCDLEIVIEKEKQSVRFTIPTRFLLDEMNWHN